MRELKPLDKKIAMDTVAGRLLWWFSQWQEMQVRSLGRQDSLEKEMAIHSSILAWKILWKEEPGRLQPMGSEESDMT